MARSFTADNPGLELGSALSEWTFSISGEVDEGKRWTWEEFRALPSETITRYVHCPTGWSKLDTAWTGVSIDTLLDGVGTAAEYVMAFCDGGYTTNLPIEDISGGKAWIAFAYDGQPLEPEHGGPARLLVPQLHFWKSAKWVRGLHLITEETPGFWETYGFEDAVRIAGTQSCGLISAQLKPMVRPVTPRR